MGETVTPDKLIMPSSLSIEHLAAACKGLQQIGNRFVLLPGMYLPTPGKPLVQFSSHLPSGHIWDSVITDKPHAIPLVNGTYGLGIRTERGDLLAFCGFNVHKGELILSHTPQGNTTYIDKSDKLPSRARNELVRSDFKQELLDGLIGLASALGLKRIRGLSVENSRVATAKIIAGDITPERARALIDDFFTSHGFSPQDGDFVKEV